MSDTESFLDGETHCQSDIEYFHAMQKTYTVETSVITEMITRSVGAVIFEPANRVRISCTFRQ